MCALLLLAACDDTTDSIGISLTDNSDQLAVSSSIFKAFSRSVAVDSVVSKSSSGYLGRIKDPETDAYVTGDFMTQFNFIEGSSIIEEDSVVGRDEKGRAIADSCDIRLYYNSYYGDSLALMKLTLYELDHPMLENETYYSDYNPIEDGNVRMDGESWQNQRLHQQHLRTSQQSLHRQGWPYLQQLRHLCDAILL